MLSCAAHTPDYVPVSQHVPCKTHHFGSANYCLGCESNSLIAGQARRNGSVSHGLQHLKHIRRAATSQSSRCVHHVLFDAHGQSCNPYTANESGAYLKISKAPIPKVWNLVQ